MAYDELLNAPKSLIPEGDEEGVYNGDFRASLLRSLLDVKGKKTHSTEDVKGTAGNRVTDFEVEYSEESIFQLRGLDTPAAKMVVEKIESTRSDSHRIFVGLGREDGIHLPFTAQPITYNSNQNSKKSF